MGKKFTEPTNPLHYYIKRIDRVCDPLTVVIISHILTEYLINEIIRNKCIYPEKIVDDRQYTYSMKLNTIYSIGLISQDVYDKLSKLNNIRNRYAHDLRPNKKSILQSISSIPTFSSYKNKTGEDDNDYFNDLHQFCGGSLAILLVEADKLNVKYQLEPIRINKF